MTDPARSSVFRLCQEGYASVLPVRAVLVGEGPAVLKDSTGKELFRLEAEPAPTDAASGDRASLFSPGRLAPGCYFLEACGEKRKFEVTSDPWRSVTNALIKGFYFQRCGCALDRRYAGDYAHPACHTAPAVDWLDRSVSRRVTGGWHDAGDYGKYTGPGAVAAAHLLYAWLLFPEGCSGSLNIPESGSELPDLLSECAWELNWILQMQRSDGSFHHKLTKDHFAPFIMPQEDLDPEYLMPASHCATAAAAACLALAFRIYRAYDPAFANRMLLSAVHAWDWLQHHPDFVPFRNPEGVHTGVYGDGSDSDERFWAACELFAATGESRFREEAERLYAAGQQLTAFGWANVGGLGALCCLFVLKEKAGPVLFTELREKFLRQSEKPLSCARASGYGTALSPEQYGWGSVLPILSGAMAMMMNHLLTGRTDMLDAALDQWYYVLGMNALDLCFITGFGENTVCFPHHRPSGADGIDAPVPGLISGGPNKYASFPATRSRLGENTPPAKSFVDETFSADTNEIAVYWNSPAVFVAAFFTQLCVKGGAGTE